MRKDNVGKVTLLVQNSLGIIMWKFPSVQSKTEGMAASVRVFFEHPSYVIITCKYEMDPINNSQEKVATPFYPL